MTRILANPTVVVVVLALALAGDAFRNALGVPVWAALVVVAFGWGLATLVTSRTTWRELPVPLIALLGWWVASTAWSPYAVTSIEMVVSSLLAAATAWALVRTLSPATAIRRVGLTLRTILGLSLAFELLVALLGHPIYPVGVAVTSGTPIESAWSRGELFELDARIQGIVGNANVLGMLALVLLVIAVWRMSSTRSWRSSATVDSVLALVMLLRTSSATVTLTLMGLLVLVGLFALARRRGIGWRAALVIALLGLAGGISGALAQWGAVTALLGKSPDLTHRFDIWAAVGARIADSPIVGHGFVGWWPTWEPWFAIDKQNGLRVAQAHNLWFDLVLQTGVVGAVLFATVLGAGLIRLGRAFLRTPQSPTTVAFLVLAALTIQSLTESRLLHEWGLMTVVALAMVAKRAGTKPISVP